MPHSAHEYEQEQQQPEPVVPGQGLAVTAEVLYITNLLLLPGLAFIALLVVYVRNIRSAPALAACHCMSGTSGQPPRLRPVTCARHCQPACGQVPCCWSPIS